MTTLLLTAGAHAATDTVTNLLDTGMGSLRATIASASAGDTIIFGVTGTITLQSQLQITEDLTITGPGAASITISGNSAVPIFSVASGVTATISGVTLSGGAAGAGNGGAIDSAGTLSVTDCIISSNSAADGGGIYVSAGTLTVLDSTFSGNSATGGGNGGAIAIAAGTATVTNSTFAANTAASGQGGGIYSNGTLSITNSTISTNSATGGAGGGVYTGGTLTLANTIIAGNTAPTSADLDGTITNDNGGNQVSTSASTINLAALGSYGGSLPTMLPLPGSSAICAGIKNQDGGLTTDERGFTLGASSYCDSTRIDAGAVQTNYSSIQFTNAGTSGYAGVVSQPITSPAAPNVSVTENGQNVGGVAVTLTFNGSGNVSGNGPVTTVAGSGATFSGLTVDTAGASDTLSATLQITSTQAITATAANLVVESPITLTSTIAPAYVGALYSQLLVSGGTAPYTTSVTSGSLPSGFSVDSTGTLSGTATAVNSYSFTLKLTDNYGFSATQTYTLTVNKGTATVSLNNLTQTYGSVTPVTATTTPSNLTVDITYNGSSTEPTTAGTYPVSASVNDTNYQGSTTGVLTINKATATLSLNNLNQTFGSVTPVTATTTPSNLTVDITYNGSSTEPTTAGTYVVAATISDTNYQGTANGELVISKSGSATVTLGGLSQTYTGSQLQATATTNPTGLSVTFTYDGSSTAPTNAGTYHVVGTINDTNYQGSTSGSMVISPAAATVTLGSLSQPYTGSPINASATTSPTGLPVTLTYNGSPTAPTAAGSYTVVGAVSNPNYTGSATGTLVIGQATASVTLGGLSQTYTGSPLQATATTSPTGLNVTFTYNGSSTAPTNAGTYTVVGTISNADYSGSTTGSLVISKAATSTSVQSSLPTSVVDQQVVFSASVTPAALSAAGTVTFTDTTSGATLCSNLKLIDGEVSCSTSLLTANSGQTVVATYSGDNNTQTSSGSASQSVSAAASTLMLTSSLNPSVVTNAANSMDSVTFTAAVAPAGQPVGLGGSVLFTDNGQLIPECAAAVPVTASGIVSCTTTSLAAGSHTILAAYNNDHNYTPSSNSLAQAVEDYALSASPTSAIAVTQGFVSAPGVSNSDPFNAQTILVTPATVSGYTGTLSLTCNVANITTVSGATAPKCTLSSSTVTLTSSPVQQPVGLTIDATNASPGSYAVSVTSIDPTTQISHTSAPFVVNVRSAAAPLTLVSGATTANSSTVNFILPANVSLSGISCTSAAGPTLTAPVDPGALSIGCALNPTSVSASTSIQSAAVSVTVSTGAATTAQLAERSNYLAAGVLGIPLLGLLGLLGGSRKSGTAIFRLFAVLAIVAVSMQVMGCGGSFTRPATVSGSTPPGSYDLLVQGTGSDNQVYQAVVELDVTR